ncbi:MAG: glycoside hydrolase family 127 protein [Clostridia bacterium]|nr:glycoside hydrolase family 127 protein [Clostridia bacterium]
MEQYYDYNGKMKVKDLLFTPLHGVKLTGGLFRRIFENNLRLTLKNLDIDRMRYWFDVKAGREPTAPRYDGVFEDYLEGQTASQYLMALGNFLRWEEDPEARACMRRVLDFLEDSQETNGFLLPIDKRDFAQREYPHYVRIWLSYALVAAGNSGEKRAFRMLRLWQDWFNRCPDLPVIKDLTLAYQGVVASPIVYATEIGIPEDMDKTIEHYEETWRLAQFVENEPWATKTRRQHGKEPHVHGNELEGFEGYLDLYRYTGAPYYLSAVKRCLAQYRRDWQHPGGGLILCERFGDNPLGHRLIYLSKEQPYNEVCTSVFWLGIHQRLHRLEPEREDYVFEMEQSLYNIIFAAQNEDIDIRSYMFLDNYKRGPIRPNHCCSGSVGMAMAKLPEYLFTMTKDTLSCDIYASAVLNWETAHGSVRVTEETDYPYNGKVSFTFDPEIPHDLTVKLRIPRYATGKVDVYLNGEVCATGDPGSYVTLFRRFEVGDVISLEIPFAFAMHPYEGEHDVAGYRRAAYTYGPLLLALCGTRNHECGTVAVGTPEEFLSRLVPTDEPLRFDVTGMEGYTVRPYFDFQDGSFVCFPLFPV